MDVHALKRERSLALHAAVAERLRSDPALMQHALSKLDEWLVQGGSSAPLLLRWREILALPLDKILTFLTARSEEADQLRKASPFAGLIPARERERILREVRERLESAA